MEIQRGKEGMALQEFNPKYGGCTGNVLRTLDHINNHEQFYKKIPGTNSQESTFGPMRSAEYKVQCENSEKQIILGDAYFSSVKSAVLTMTLYGRHYAGVVKNCHSKFPKKFLTETLSEAPVGAHMLLSTNHDRVYICALGYKYVKSRKPIVLVFTHGAGTLVSLNIPRTLWERMIPTVTFMRRLLNVHKLRINTSKRAIRLMYTTINTNTNFNFKKMVDNRPMVSSYSTTLIDLHVVDAYSLYLYHHRVEKQRKQHL